MILDRCCAGIVLYTISASERVYGEFYGSRGSTVILEYGRPKVNIMNCSSPSEEHHLWNIRRCKIRSAISTHTRCTDVYRSPVSSGLLSNYESSFNVTWYSYICNDCFFTNRHSMLYMIYILYDCYKSSFNVIWYSYYMIITNAIIWYSYIHRLLRIVIQCHIWFTYYMIVTNRHLMSYDIHIIWLLRMP